MKKYRVSLNPENPKAKYTLNVFSSPEAIYLHNSGDILDSDISIKKFLLSKDCWLELEWLGCEFDFDEETKKSIRFDNVCVVKVVELKGTNSVLSYSVGWIKQEDMPGTETNKNQSIVFKKLNNTEPQTDTSKYVVYPDQQKSAVGQPSKKSSILF